MFKNMRVYRIPQHWAMPKEEIELALNSQVFKPIGEYEYDSTGWIAPRGESLVHCAVRGQLLFKLRTEKKSLPYSAVKEALKAKVASVTEEQGFAPGRKATKELKEHVIDEMLPKAFTVASETSVWLDQENGWLVIDTPSTSRADLAVKYLIRSFAKLPLETLYVAKPIGETMTDWLYSDEAPDGFTVDQDAELRSRTEDKATVKYVRQNLTAEDLRTHIEAGKKCIKLALTYDDRLSFVLTDDMAIKRIKVLDVLKEDFEKSSDADERFDSDFALMAGEFNRLLGALIEAFGGEAPKPINDDLLG